MGPEGKSDDGESSADGPPANTNSGVALTEDEDTSSEDEFFEEEQRFVKGGSGEEINKSPSRAVLQSVQSTLRECHCAEQQGGDGSALKISEKFAQDIMQRITSEVEEGRIDLKTL